MNFQEAIENNGYPGHDGIVQVLVLLTNSKVSQ